MLLIKSVIRQSNVQGVGLFAEEDIPEGAVIWRRDPEIDRSYSLEEIDRFPSIEKYVYPREGNYVLCGDDARFINHSNSPNCRDDIPADKTVAIRCIQKGEEITVDYRVYGEPLGFDPSN